MMIVDRFICHTGPPAGTWVHADAAAIARTADNIVGTSWAQKIDHITRPVVVAFVFQADRLSDFTVDTID